jgi:hypothetical protein
MPRRSAPGGKQKIGGGITAPVVFVPPERVRAATNGEPAMQVQVETYMEEGGNERLRRFYLNGRQIEATENIDQWHGAYYRYFSDRKHRPVARCLLPILQGQRQ